MAIPVKGSWARKNANRVPYDVNRVWGTGINPIHAEYGSVAARLQHVHIREGDHIPANESIPEGILNPHGTWGYTPEDSNFTGVYYDDRPTWAETTPDFRAVTSGHPPYNADGAERETFRERMEGAHRYNQKLQTTLPTETVSEGWENKATGAVADAKPSSDTQLTVRTSMQQRYQQRNNQAAVNRGTDGPREKIDSRVAGQVVKVYSGGERHYDMEPKRQDPIPRPFYYRTAGTGRWSDLLPNRLLPTRAPIQRVPPQDPYVGIKETDVTPDYGYTDEDPVYYA